MVRVKIIGCGRVIRIPGWHGARGVQADAAFEGFDIQGRQSGHSLRDVWSQLIRNLTATARYPKVEPANMEHSGNRCANRTPTSGRLARPAAFRGTARGRCGGPSREQDRGPSPLRLETPKRDDPRHGSPRLGAGPPIEAASATPGGAHQRSIVQPVRGHTCPVSPDIPQPRPRSDVPDGRY